MATTNDTMAQAAKSYFQCQSFDMLVRSAQCVGNGCDDDMANMTMDDIMGEGGDRVKGKAPMSGKDGTWVLTSAVIVFTMQTGQS
jgi:hypothetical protein